jgi:hypothetical protein
MVMTDLLGLVGRKAARIRALVTQPDATGYVRSVLDQKLAELSDEHPMGIATRSLPDTQRLLASARVTAEHLDEPERILSRPEGIPDLDAIEWCLRPALPIRAGRITPPGSPPWNDLAPDMVAGPSRRVCRIDVGVRDAEPFQLGTGFVAGGRNRDAYIIVTNTHVVREALRFGWATDPDVGLYGDFDRTSIAHDGPRHRLRTSHALHDRHDLAALYLDASDQLAFAEHDDLTLTDRAPDPAVGAKIGVLGHPHFDSRRDPFPQHFGFGHEYGIKRFSPGLLRALESRRWHGYDVEVMLHDATTLSGSSGSCILDLRSREVVGLHFGGWPARHRVVSTPAADLVAQLFEANGAVPLWRLAGDPIFDEIR